MASACDALGHTYQFADDGFGSQPHMLPEAGYVTIGKNDRRGLVAVRLGVAGKLFGPALIHPKASVARSSIGCGTVVMAGAIVQPDSLIGEHVIINTNSSVDHDCVIGNFCHVAPGATLCGNVTLGCGAFIGAGAIVAPGVRVGRWQFVKAGTVVKGDLPDAEVAAVDAAADSSGNESVRERGA